MDYDEIGRRLFRFIVAVLMGVGLTLAWQSYGNDGLEMARSYAPSLAWLLPVPKTNLPRDNQMSAAEIAIEVKQQLKPLALEFGVVQRRMEQLAAKIDDVAANQKQVAQHIATLQAVDHDISQRPAGASTSIDVGQQGSNQETSSAPTSASTPADAGQQVSEKCDIEACKQAYFTFNPADCTYQPGNGPRRLCTKGTPPSARPAQTPAQEIRADTAAAPQVSNKCDIDACKQAYFTFNPADCTYQPSNGPRRLCRK